MRELVEFFSGMNLRISEPFENIEISERFQDDERKLSYVLGFAFAILAVARVGRGRAVEIVTDAISELGGLRELYQNCYRDLPLDNKELLSRERIAEFVRGVVPF